MGRLDECVVLFFGRWGEGIDDSRSFSLSLSLAQASRAKCDVMLCFVLFCCVVLCCRLGWIRILFAEEVTPWWDDDVDVDVVVGGGGLACVSEEAALSVVVVS